MKRDALHAFAYRIQMLLARKETIVPRAVRRRPGSGCGRAMPARPGAPPRDMRFSPIDGTDRLVNNRADRVTAFCAVVSAPHE